MPSLSHAAPKRWGRQPRPNNPSDPPTHRPPHGYISHVSTPPRPGPSKPSLCSSLTCVSSVRVASASRENRADPGQVHKRSSMPRPSLVALVSSRDARCAAQGLRSCWRRRPGVDRRDVHCASQGCTCEVMLTANCCADAMQIAVHAGGYVTYPAPLADGKASAVAR